jgi:hypothetical protein
MRTTDQTRRRTVGSGRSAKSNAVERIVSPSRDDSTQGESELLTSLELHTFMRDYASIKVLSVYVDARVTDPAMRHAWRPALTAALRAARAELDDELALDEFDRSAAFLDQPLPPLEGAWGAPGWVAFCTAKGVRYAAHVPVEVPTMVVWGNGPFVSPYLRVLKQHRPVIVAVVESRRARLFRYGWGMLTPLPDVSLVLPEGRPGGTSDSEARPMRSSASRGAVGTDTARRHRRAVFSRHVAALAGRLVDLAGDDGWIVIGGTAEWARSARAAIPARLAGRTMVVASLDHGASNAEVARAAEHAATAMRATHGRLLLDHLPDREGSRGRGTAGLPATQRALQSHAVDLLLLSPEYIRWHPFDAEEFVRATFAQGADVEVLSGQAADDLDRMADGIAARLRFSIDEPIRDDADDVRQSGARFDMPKQFPIGHPA